MRQYKVGSVSPQGVETRPSGPTVIVKGADRYVDPAELMKPDRDALSDFTADELAELYDIPEIIVRKKLKQLGIAAKRHESLKTSREILQELRDRPPCNHAAASESTPGHKWNSFAWCDECEAWFWHGDPEKKPARRRYGFGRESLTRRLLHRVLERYGDKCDHANLASVAKKINSFARCPDCQKWVWHGDKDLDPSNHPQVSGHRGMKPNLSRILGPSPAQR